ncbi:MAG: hypothetical protein JRI23_33745 [Deltaproteobacteria bacterium]|jgi:hypothetical protein|nr:hypothetical protein [Deltaproteobacteria bacterium]MBW2537246.1 hypothetical protein [Deltaproteobacteria bacterium]
MRRGLALLLGLTLTAVSSPRDVAAAPAASPSQPAPSGATAQGAIVVSPQSACRPQAKALARSVYADVRLRPQIEEATARALVGEQRAPPREAPSTTDPKLAEIQEVVASIGEACPTGCPSAGVGRSLATSLGRELGAALVVVVSCSADPSTDATPPAAQPLRVAQGQFARVVLTPKTTAGQPDDWSDAAAVLRALLPAAETSREQRSAATSPLRPKAAPEPARPHTPAPTVVEKAPPDSEEEGFDFISSPWFWGGLGAVVAVGVTVIALSQTSLDDPGVVQLQGRVSP